MQTDDPNNKPANRSGVATPPTTEPSADGAESSLPARSPHTATPAKTGVEFGTLADFADHRLEADPAELETVRISQAEARRPRPDEFFRVHPTATLQVAMLEVTRLRTEVIVAPSAQGSVVMKLKRRVLRLCINHHDELFIWAIGVPTGGAPNPWLTSAARAADVGTRGWVRVVASATHYEIDRPVGDHTLPADVNWPTTPFSELVEAAYVGRIIRSTDHALLEELRGRVL
jgi:hypothetical protein